MPTVIELRLKAGRPVQPDTRQLHGLACALFEGAEVAGHLSQVKPFAVWPLQPVPGEGEGNWTLRAAWLASGSPPPGPVIADTLRLGHVTCAVTETVHRMATHAQLAAGPALSESRIVFRSPTYFSQNGTDVVLPDPRLILGSWRRRWNASLDPDAVLSIDDDAWREVHKAACLAAFDLRTGFMDSGRGHERIGFTGSATLRLSKGSPAEVRAVFGALARFAEFCGTGAQTTHGFGATTLGGSAPGR